MTRKFAYLTDCHLDEQHPRDYGIDPRENWKRVLQDLKDRNIKEVVFGGDIGTPESNAWFFSTLRGFRLALTPGNHDSFDELSKHLSEGVNSKTKEIYFTREDELYRYFYLDTSTSNISENQINWLEGNLQTDKTIVLFIHHPAFPVDSIMDVKYPLGNREKLSALLTKTGKRIFVFNGHYHFDDVQTIGKTKQIITPSTCFQVEKQANEVKVISSTFGYRIIHLEDGEVSTELVMFER